MPAQLICELATSHGGDIALAKEMIQRCVEAGAHWVKFQSFQVKHLRPGDPQADWLKQSELSDDAHHELIAACQEAGVKFLSTVFTADRVPFLASLGLEAIKIGAAEASEAQLVDDCIQAFTFKFISLTSPYSRCAPGGRAVNGCRFMRCL